MVKFEGKFTNYKDENLDEYYSAIGNVNNLLFFDEQ